MKSPFSGVVIAQKVRLLRKWRIAIVGKEKQGKSGSSVSFKKSGFSPSRSGRIFPTLKRSSRCFFVSRRFFE